MNSINFLSWSNLKTAAESTFETFFEGIFSSDKFRVSGLEQSDVEKNSLEWVRQAWEILIKLELANYSTEAERSKVIIRFFLIAKLYIDFFALVWQNNFQKDKYLWIDVGAELELWSTNFRNLINSQSNSNLGEDNNDDVIDDLEIKDFTSESHPEVIAALLFGFKSESILFDSLWHSIYVNEDDDEYKEFSQDDSDLDEDDQDERYEEISNDINIKKKEALSWLNQQCSSRNVQEIFAQIVQKDIQTKTSDLEKNDVIKFPFSHRTFELLSQLRSHPNERFYQLRKNKFKQHVEKPFQEIYRQVANQIPNQMTKWLDMNCEMFAYPEWNLYYKGFFPCKNISTKEANFFIDINYTHLFFGFIVYRGSSYQNLFLENLQKYSEVKDFVLENKLDSRCQLHGKKKRRSSYSLSSWLKKPAGKNTTHKSIQSSVHLSIETVLRSSTEELTNRILQTFQTIFPLFLIAICDEPMSAIKEYMNPYNQLSLSLNYQPTLLPNKTNKIKLKSIYTLSQCAQETNFTKAQLTQWIRAINRKKQAIFQGPSGTGKTFISQKLAQHLIAGGDGFWELIQFHPAYTYEDFIQGIRPQSEDGKLTYPVLPGRFLKFCRKAALCQDTCVLIIDEINRANLSQVFGELMYLLEYRDEKIPLAGSGELFSIPENVRIIGTMNTADRSIALVDHALRRRFAFITLSPNYEILRQYHNETKTDFLVDGLIKVLKEVNQEIKDSHYEVGVSFFLRENIDEEIQDIWQMEIEPYLEEFFFAQPEKVDEFRWDKICQQILPPT